MMGPVLEPVTHPPAAAATARVAPASCADQRHSAPDVGGGASEARSPAASSGVFPASNAYASPSAVPTNTTRSNGHSDEHSAGADVSRDSSRVNAVSVSVSVLVSECSSSSRKGGTCHLRSTPSRQVVHNVLVAGSRVTEVTTLGCLAAPHRARRAPTSDRYFFFFAGKSTSSTASRGTRHRRRYPSRPPEATSAPSSAPPSRRVPHRCRASSATAVTAPASYRPSSDRSPSPRSSVSFQSRECASGTEATSRCERARRSSGEPEWSVHSLTSTAPDAVPIAASGNWKETRLIHSEEDSCTTRGRRPPCFQRVSISNRRRVVCSRRMLMN